MKFVLELVLNLYMKMKSKIRESYRGWWVLYKKYNHIFSEAMRYDDYDFIRLQYK